MHRLGLIFLLSALWAMGCRLPQSTPRFEANAVVATGNGHLLVRPKGGFLDPQRRGLGASVAQEKSKGWKV